MKKNKMIPSQWLSLLFSALLIYACNGKKSGQEQGKQPPITAVESSFSADSAYRHIEQQLAYGPRVPNSPGHKACGDYLIAQLKGYGLELNLQESTLKAYDGTPLHCRNIIASYHGERSARILLFAHWDTRPFADHDPDPRRRKDPIPGADDGASGTAVLLEIARLLQQYGLDHYGVDLLFLDAEDYGVPHGEATGIDSEKSWALGAQYFAANPHKEDYTADFGILLDMVGAKGAKFYREFYSQEHAAKQLSKIWGKAKEMGYGHYFINKSGGAITDDHVFIIRGLGIPCVDIINYDPQSSTGFGSHWHTHADKIDVIDKESLQAVGAVVWEVLKMSDVAARQKNR